MASDSKQPPDYIFYGRRLSDKLLIAFDKACDVGELGVAGELLQILERLAAKEGAASEFRRRVAAESLVQAHERLWLLRNEKPDT